MSGTLLQPQTLVTHVQPVAHFLVRRSMAEQLRGVVVVVADKRWGFARGASGCARW